MFCHFPPLCDVPLLDAKLMLFLLLKALTGKVPLGAPNTGVRGCQLYCES